MKRKIDNYFDQIVVNNFNSEAVEKFRKAVTEEALCDSKKPIIIYIDSDGGEVDSLAAMIDILESIPNPIHTVCIGRASSAGAILLAYGDERWCGKHSTVMVHEFSGGAIGQVHDVSTGANELVRCNDFWYSLMAEWCGYSSRKTFLKTLSIGLERDKYMDANEAKLVGIVDHIGVPEMRLKTRSVGRKRKRKVK